MHIGEECMVLYSEGERNVWHNAKIKSIQKFTVSVIWMEGEYRGTETVRIPHGSLFLDDTKNDLESLKKDMQEVKEKLERTHNGSKAACNQVSVILKEILIKLDDLDKKVDRRNSLLKDEIFNDDVVSYNSSLNKLSDSLRGLDSMDMEDNSSTFSNMKNTKKYYSFEGNNRY